MYTPHLKVSYKTKEDKQDILRRKKQKYISTLTLLYIKGIIDSSENTQETPHHDIKKNERLSGKLKGPHTFRRTRCTPNTVQKLRPILYRPLWKKYPPTRPRTQSVSSQRRRQHIPDETHQRNRTHIEFKKYKYFDENKQ